MTARGTGPRRRARSSRTRSRRPTRSPTPRWPTTTAKLLDELGDLLFQACFLALLLEERGEGDLAEVARRIHDKLVRRHPHVFETPGARHCRRREEPLGGAEVRAGAARRDLPRRARDVAGAAPRPEGAAPRGDGRVRLRSRRARARRTSRTSSRSSATSYARRAPETEPDPRAAAELGDLLFACVNVARRLNVDPELALRRATGRFVSRVERAAELAAPDGRDVSPIALPVGSSRTDTTTAREGGARDDRARGSPACTRARSSTRAGTRPSRSTSSSSRDRRAAPPFPRARRPDASRRSSCATATRAPTSARASSAPSRT